MTEIRRKIGWTFAAVLAVVALWAMNEPWEEHSGAPEPCVPEWTHYGQTC